MSEEKNNLVSECCGARVNHEITTTSAHYICSICGEICKTREAVKQEEKKVIGKDICECGEKFIKATGKYKHSTKRECEKCHTIYIEDITTGEVFKQPTEQVDGIDNIKPRQKNYNGFQKGVSGNPAGRPKKKKEPTKADKQREARKVFNEAMDGQWGKIMEKVNDFIEKGDKDMIKFIIEQRIGKAPQTIHNTGDALVELNVGQAKYATIIKREANDIDRGTVDDNDSGEQEQTD